MLYISIGIIFHSQFLLNEKVILVFSSFSHFLLSVLLRARRNHYRSSVSLASTYKK